MKHPKITVKLTPAEALAIVETARRPDAVSVPEILMAMAGRDKIERAIMRGSR